MTSTDALLAVVIFSLMALLVAGHLQHAELIATLNALAEMLGEEIDRRKAHDE